MNILITCQFFSYFSGSATYVLDLAIELVRRGNKVTILSSTGGEITDIAEKKGIRVVDFNYVEDILSEKFDIIHGNQEVPTWMAARGFNAPVVQTLHNSLGYEAPCIHPNVKRYIAAKESELEHFKELNPTFIRIGVDLNKYRPMPWRARKEGSKECVAFIGTYDHLRARALQHLIMLSRKQDFDVVYIGKPMMDLALPESVKVVPETSNIEEWMNASSAVASILQGRTAIEAWACGKDYYCYDVDAQGNILSMNIMPPPESMYEYDIRYMTDRVEQIYKEAIDSYAI